MQDLMNSSLDRYHHLHGMLEIDSMIYFDKFDLLYKIKKTIPNSSQLSLLEVYNEYKQISKMKTLEVISKDIIYELWKNETCLYIDYYNNTIKCLLIIILSQIILEAFHTLEEIYLRNNWTNVITFHLPRTKLTKHTLTHLRKYIDLLYPNNQFQIQIHFKEIDTVHNI